MSVFDSLSSAERARQLRNPEGEVGLAVAAWLNGTNRQGNARVLAALAIEPQSRVPEIGFGNGHAVPGVLAVATDGHYCRDRYLADHGGGSETLQRQILSPRSRGVSLCGS